jgi:hypothetical protein
MMAMMIMHSSLQVEDPEVAMAHFGNLPGYCVEFVCGFMYQLYHMDSKGDIYYPKGVKQHMMPNPIIPALLPLYPDCNHIGLILWLQRGCSLLR